MAQVASYTFRELHPRPNAYLIPTTFSNSASLRMITPTPFTFSYFIPPPKTHVQPEIFPAVRPQSACPAVKSTAPSNFSCSPRFPPIDSAPISPPCPPTQPLPQSLANTDPQRPSPTPCPPADPQSCRPAHQYSSRAAPQNAVSILSSSPGTPHSRSGTPLPLPHDESCCRIPGIASACETLCDSSLPLPPSRHPESLPP